MPGTVICDLLRRRIVGRKGIFRFQLVDRADLLLRSDIVQRNILCRRHLHDFCRRIRDLCELRQDCHVMTRHFERIFAVCNARRHIRTIYRQRIQKIPCCRRDRQRDRFAHRDILLCGSVDRAVRCGSNRQIIVLCNVNMTVPIVVPVCLKVNRNRSGRRCIADHIITVVIAGAVPG